jgi:ribonuclease HI
MHKLYFDGSSKMNPGPASSAYIIYQNDIIIAKDAKRIGNQTNNYAEYTGLIMGLEKALELAINDIEIYGDSKLVIEQMKDSWAVKSDNIKPLHAKASALKVKFNNIIFTHVRREFNKEADRLCNEVFE